MESGGVYKEMTNALNLYFEEQAKLDGKCLVDYVQFDTEYETVFTDTPVYAAKALIQPRGGTALVDAIGRGTVELGRKLQAMPEDKRPGKVQVVVVTDGGENASSGFTAEEVHKMVSVQQDTFSWDYVFLGANIDAVQTGAMYGFQPTKSMTFDTKNTAETINSLNNYTTSYRVAGAAAFTDEDRENAVK